MLESESAFAAGGAQREPELIRRGADRNRRAPAAQFAALRARVCSSLRVLQPKTEEGRENVCKSRSVNHDVASAQIQTKREESERDYFVAHDRTLF